MNPAVKAIEYYLPEKTLSNEDLQNVFSHSIPEEDFIKLGIKQRHIRNENQTAIDLAYEAAEKLFQSGAVQRNEIDALIYCSGHNDYITPPNSCVLHGRLSLSENVATYDLTHGCSGYIYGLNLAKAIILAYGYKNVLFLTGSILSIHLHPKDKASRMVFGDAGTATLIGHKEGNHSIGDFIMRTDGKGFDKIIIKDGMNRFPINPESFIERTDEYGNTISDASFAMDGVAVLLFTLKKVPALIYDTLHKNNLSIEEIDLFILHQANIFINEQVRKKMKIPEEKFHYCVENTGNTVHGTIPIALLDAISKGKVNAGNKILIAGFGVGLSWGATVITL